MHKMKLTLISALTLLLAGCNAEPEKPLQKTADELAYISDDSPVRKARLDMAISPLFDDPAMAETRAFLIMHRGSDHRRALWRGL